MEATTDRFIQAINAIKEEKGVSVLEICTTTGIDRRNLMRLVNDPEHHYPRPMWMSALCECYRVSARFLLLGKGGIFNGR